MLLTDVSLPSWGPVREIGRWRDFKNKPIEKRLSEAMAAIATSAIDIKHRLAAEAKAARRREEKKAKELREKQRHEQALRRREFLIRKADDYHRYQRLKEFSEYLDRTAFKSNQGSVDKIIIELRTIVQVSKRAFERETTGREIESLQLLCGEDLHGGSHEE